MADSGIPLRPPLRIPLGDFLRLLETGERPAETPRRVWRCDYCSAEYDTRREACGNCWNPKLRPPEEDPEQEG